MPAHCVGASGFRLLSVARRGKMEEVTLSPDEWRSGLLVRLQLSKLLALVARAKCPAMEDYRRTLGNRALGHNLATVRSLGSEANNLSPAMNRVE